MKTLIKLCLPILLLLFSVSAFAQDSIIDNANQLSQQQKASLTQQIEAVASNYNFDLVIVTENSISETDIDAAVNSLFNSNAYGLGNNRDVCLLLNVTELRDFRFSASGKGSRVLSSAARNKLEGDIYKSLKNENPYEAYTIFIADWEKFLELDAKGRSYNFFSEWNIILIPAAWLLALLIGLIVVASWKSGMNTALAQAQASVYVVPNSLKYNEKKDTFLYSNVSKTRRQSSASSGRSSISSGSSGRKSGGRKY